MERTVSSEAYYEIHIAGHLGPEWADWFDGLAITPGPDGTTILSGPMADQAALHGHLARVRDLALPLLMVVRCPAQGP